MAQDEQEECFETEEGGMGRISSVGPEKMLGSGPTENPSRSAHAGGCLGEEEQ